VVVVSRRDATVPTKQTRKAKGKGPIPPVAQKSKKKQARTARVQHGITIQSKIKRVASVASEKGESEKEERKKRQEIKLAIVCCCQQ
jgi:hypothetical protein